MKMNLVVKWSGKEYNMQDIDVSLTVHQFKQLIQEATGVRIERQKLLNLRLKGKPVDDNAVLSSLNLKDGFKVMMMGSLEDVIAQANALPESDDVVNDLDMTDEEISIDKSIYQTKLQKRISTYKLNILNEPRENRKLLVLDIDYTIFDHRSTAETAAELMRPYLHEFLKAVYPVYDLVFWSATSMKWIIEKLRMLGVSQHPDYKVVCYVDSAAMISIETPKGDLIDVKPLDVLWGLLGQYNATNTVMLDDIRRNFTMNPQSGLKIRPFRKAHFTRHKDKELLSLARYLRYIAIKDYDFTTLNHRHWEKFVENKPDLDEIVNQKDDE